MRALLQLVLCLSVVACVSAGPAVRVGSTPPALRAAVDPARLAQTLPAPSVEACSNCSVLPMTSDVTAAIAARVADLKALGGDCMTYGDVLEMSLAAGRITVRPYMWRVGPNLASASATPGGDMLLAREIDPLNVGVRTVSDVLQSLEHEAAHVAFRLVAGDPASEQLADEHVRACRPRAG